MATYRFLFSNLSTGAVIAELPLIGVSFSQMLNGAGSLSAILALGDARLVDLDWQSALTEAKTAVYVERDGALVWGGILWTSRRNSAGSVSIGAREFWSYFERRFITADVAFTNVDQLTIAAAFVNTAQAAAHGSLGIIVPTITSGVLRTVSYTAAQSTRVSQAMSALSGQDRGLDFAVDVAYAGTPPAPQLSLRLSYPRRGRPAGQSGLVFTLPGNILKYDWPRDGAKLATTSYAQGVGHGTAMLRSSASNTALLNAGYPLLEDLHAYKDVLDQGTLDSRAQSDSALLSQLAEPATVTVLADADPILGSYIVGDEAHFLLTDPAFPAPGLDKYYRIVGLSVAVPQGGVHEAVTFTLGATM